MNSTRVLSRLCTCNSVQRHALSIQAVRTRVESILYVTMASMYIAYYILRYISVWGYFSVIVSLFFCVNTNNYKILYPFYTLTSFIIFYGKIVNMHSYYTQIVAVNVRSKQTYAFSASLSWNVTLCVLHFYWYTLSTFRILHVNLERFSSKKSLRHVSSVSSRGFQYFQDLLFETLTR